MELPAIAPQNPISPEFLEALRPFLSILILLLLGAFALVVLRFLFRKARPREIYPYVRIDSLLTPAELNFYRVLLEVVGDRSLVCPKVRLADILSVEKGVQYMTHFNRIQSKHVDFLLCKPDSLEPVLVIELDDRSHRRRDRQDRDTFLEKALGAARIPIARFPVSRTYNPNEVRSVLRETTSRP